MDHLKRRGEEGEILGKGGKEEEEHLIPGAIDEKREREVFCICMRFDVGFETSGGKSGMTLLKWTFCQT